MGSTIRSDPKKHPEVWSLISLKLKIFHHIRDVITKQFTIFSEEDLEADRLKEEQRLEEERKILEAERKKQEEEERKRIREEEVLFTISKTEFVYFLKCAVCLLLFSGGIKKATRRRPQAKTTTRGTTT